MPEPIPGRAMSIDQKLEALRDDIQNITQFVNRLAADVRQGAAEAGVLRANLSAVSAQLDTLRKKVDDARED